MFLLHGFPTVFSSNLTLLVVYVVLLPSVASLSKVLAPLVEAYYGGPQGLQKAAPSNKAARQIGGQTLHATVGLKGHPNLATVSQWKANKEKDF